MTQSDDMEQQIRNRAYAIWQEEGEPEGRDAEHWAKARAEFDDAATAAPSKAARKPRTSAAKAGAESKATAPKPAKAKAPAKAAAPRKAKAKSKA
tara:strand:+ start:115 stop:399 length:285 start_codon:yes stop_codon:yes gene_type:complete